MLPNRPEVNITEGDGYFKVCFHSEEHVNIPVLKYDVLVYDLTGQKDLHRNVTNHDGSIHCISVPFVNHCAPYTVSVRAFSYQDYSESNMTVGNDTNGKKQ